MRFIAIFMFVVCAMKSASATCGAHDFNDLLGQHCRSWCGSCHQAPSVSARVGKAGPKGSTGLRGPGGPPGRPGIAGSTGPAGPRGIVGPPGTTNMTEINGIINSKMESVMSSWHPESCMKARNVTSNLQSGIFYIDHSNLGITEVYCDLETDGGGWTVFQRRVDDRVDFNRVWYGYSAGFGDNRGNFWLGLENIHQMTKDGKFELRVDMIQQGGTILYAKYSNFRIGAASDNYRMTVGGYSGNATDSLTYHHNRQFSTKDQGPSTCATSYAGAGWWYGSCYHSSLNGKYGSTEWNGIVWRDAANSYEKRTMIFTEMKFRELQ